MGSPIPIGGSSNVQNRTLGIIVGSVVVLVVAGGVGLFTLDGFLRGKLEQRRQERATEKQLVDTAIRMSEGKSLGDRPDFPDTPIGQVGAISYDMMAEMQSKQRKLTEDLERIKWDWVMSPDSIDSKADLQKSLVILGKAKALTITYEEETDRLVEETIAKVKLVGDDRSARQFAEGFSSAYREKGQGLYYFRESMRELRKNHQAMGEALLLLLKYSGKFTVDRDGAIEFSPSVPDAAVEAYNSAVDRTNTALEKINALEIEGAKAAKERIKGL